MSNAGHIWTREQVRTDILGILHDKVKKLDPDFSGTLTEETKILGDLEFESVAVVEFCTAVGKHFQRKFPFQDLVFRHGRFQDFTVADLVAFLERHLAS